jgi:hypothetical protein
MSEPLLPYAALATWGPSSLTQKSYEKLLRRQRRQAEKAFKARDEALAKAAVRLLDGE